MQYNVKEIFNEVKNNISDNYHLSTIDNMIIICINQSLIIDFILYENNYIQIKSNCNSIKIRLNQEYYTKTIIEMVKIIQTKLDLYKDFYNELSEYIKSNYFDFIEKFNEDSLEISITKINGNEDLLFINPIFDFSYNEEQYSNIDIIISDKTKFNQIKITKNNLSKICFGICFGIMSL